MCSNLIHDPKKCLVITMSICTKNVPSINKYLWEYQVKILIQSRLEIMKMGAMFCYSIK